MHKFRDLRHVPAVRGLVKKHVDASERSGNRIVIPHVALDEFRLGIYPCRLSASVSHSVHKRRKLASSSTSYPVRKSFTSSPILFARCIVWLSTRSVLQSICSNKCRCGFFIPIK